MRLYHDVKNERTGIFGCRSTLDAVQYLHKHDIVHRDLKYVFCFYNLDPAANNADPRIFCTGRENQTAMSLSLTLACKFSKENCFIDELNLTCQFRAKHLHSADEQLHSLAGSFGYVAPEVLLKQGHGKPVDIWSTGYFNLHFFGLYLTYRARIITYVLLCGYSPFRSDDVKILIKETAAAQIEFHDRYWKNVSKEGLSFYFLFNNWLISSIT